MVNLEKECELLTVSEKQLISGFDCGDEELNDFFNNKSLSFKKQLLAMTPLGQGSALSGLSGQVLPAKHLTSLPLSALRLCSATASEEEGARGLPSKKMNR